MARKRHGWILWLLAAILAAGGLGFVFWEDILLFLAPKWVLREAVNSAAEQLEERFEDSPVILLLDSLDPGGKQTARVSFETGNPLLGDVRYDMTVQTAKNQLQAQGIVSASGRELDLSVYADTDCLAVSSENFAPGSYYGITYDTFARDIRSIPLLSWFLSDGVLEEWDASVQSVRHKMEKQVQLPRLPELASEELEQLTWGLITIPAEIQESAVEVNGESLGCRRFTYVFSSDQLQSVAADGTLPDGPVTASFWLAEDKLVRLEISWQEGESSRAFSLALGRSIPADPLHFTWQTGDERYAFDVTTRQNDTHYAEDWNIRHDEETRNISYDWNRENGNMALTARETASVSLTVSETEDGFFLQTESFSALMAALTGEAPSIQVKECAFSTKKGAMLAKPDYKNTDQWSMEDFVMLAEGLGGLIGLKIA